MEALREDPGMSLGFFGQHGRLCVWGQLWTILGCPWDPPDCLKGCVWGTSREDPGIPLGSPRLPGGLGVGDIQGGPWDPPVSMEGCVCEDIKGGSCDVPQVM